MLAEVKGGSGPRSPRIRAGEYRSKASKEYLALSQAELGQIWQKEIGPLTDRRGGAPIGAPTPRLAWQHGNGGGNGGARASGDEPGGAHSGGNGSPWALKPPADFELALTSVVSLAQAKGEIVRRIII